MLEFSLVEQPWIQVRMLDGSRKTVGLREIFTRAHDIADVVDDVAPAVMAVHRLLLAILHRSAGPKNMRDWLAAWRRGSFDDRPARYLDGMRDRFDLFHPERPFFQTRAAEAAKPVSILKLFYIGADSSVFLRQGSWDDPKPVPASRSARMLLAVQSFGRCGMHSNLPGETDRSAVAGPLTDVVSVLITGDNLFETLLLNSPASEFLATIFPPSEEDLPWWERDEPILPNQRPASGYLDLLTRPTRRILLHPEEIEGKGVVRKVALLKGLEFPNDSRPLAETMAPVRFDDGVPAFIRMRPDMLAWQNSCALFRAFDGVLNADVDDAEAQKVRHMPSRTIQWLAQVADAGGIEGSRRFRLSVFGTDGDKGSLDFWRQESVPLRPVYLADAGLFDAVRKAIEASRTMRSLLHWSVRKGVHNVYDFGIRDEKKPGTTAKRTAEMLSECGREFMASLELSFNNFLEHLVDRPAEAVLNSWRRRLALSARIHAHAALDRLGSDVRGAMVRGSVDRCLRGSIQKFLSKEETHVAAQ